MRLRFKWIYTLILAFLVQFSFAQEKTVTGVVSENGMPLPGATVLIKGTSKGVSTDFDGKYAIAAKTGDVLEISYVGMKTKAMTVGASNKMDVVLEADNTLEEIVVVGYGRKVTKNEYTGKVSTVAAESINKTTFTDPSQALQGRVAGLQMSTSSGSPGAQQTILIRGVNSLTASNQPLYVIDGVQMTQGNFGGANATSSVSHMAGLSNDDIESMVVLKDAVAIAPYGAAGANGVILITTKRGKQGEAKFSFSSSIGFQNNATEGATPMNGAQKQLAVERGVFNTLSAQYPSVGLTPTFENTQAFILASGLSPEYADWINNPRPTTDWYEDFLRVKNATTRIADLSVSGGNEKSNFYASVGINDTEATVIGNDFKRISGSFKYNAHLRKNIRFNFGVNGSNIKNNGSLENGAFFSNGNLSRYFMSPWIPAVNPDGSPNLVMNGTTLHNTYYTAKENLRINDISRAIINTSLEFDIFKNFTYKPLIAVDYSLSMYKDWRNQFNGDGLQPGGLVFESAARTFNYTVQNQFDYKFSLNEKHNFGLSALTEFTKFKDWYLSASGTGFIKPFLQNISNAPLTPTSFSSFSDRTSMRYVGMLSYNFDRKYLLDASYTYQGDSRFEETQRFGSFYSVGAAWNAHEESFIKSIKQINDLRLKASYGTTGNSGIGRNLFQPTLGAGGYNSTGVALLNTFGQNTTWETGTRQEFTLEFGLFERNRITGSVARFNNTTENGLFNGQIPLENGFSNATINVIEMFNRGYEFELNVKLFDKENFKWSIGGNFATLNNELTKVSNNPDETFFNLGATRRYEVGYPSIAWHMPIWAGVNPANGDPLWYVDEARTQTTNVYAQANRFHTNTSPIPTFSGGINTRIEYQNFFLEALVSFQGGNQIYQDWGAFTEASRSNGIATFNATTTVLDGAWTTPGQNATHPRFAWNDPIINNAGNASSRWLKDGDFARLRDIAIGYTFKTKLIEKVGLSSLRFTVRGSNLYTWVKDKTLPYDPEVLLDSSSGLASGFTNLTNPPVKQVVFQINLNF
jgi:TonB-linked SusC/RagA family outer membrane protein